MIKIIFAVLVFSTQIAFAEKIQSGSKYDEYAKATGISTENFSVPNIGSFFEPEYAEAHIAGNVSDSGGEAIWLSIYYRSGSWRFFDRAQDIDGNKLNFNLINRAVITSGTLAEEFSVLLSRDYLEKRQLSGFDMRFLGKNGTLIVKLPPEYVQSFLTVLTDVEAKVRASAPVAKPKLGITYTPVTDQLLQLVKLSKIDGVIIATVSSGSLAERSGLMPNDVIQVVNNQRLQSTLDSLPGVLKLIEPGTLVPFTLWRNSQELKINIQF